jgi:enoyl-[acyl-carrier protein] reductase I
MNGLLAGRTIVVTGVVTDDSIAFSAARAAQVHGADVVLTAPPRDIERTRSVATELHVPVHQLDVLRAEDWSEVEAQLRDDHGYVHGALHAVAFAPAALLDGRFAPPPTADGVALAMDTSVVSYVALAELLRNLAPEFGASLVGLTFDAGRAWPTYNWMGVMKAALESANRYLARDLGPHGVRANLVAAGPLRTRAATAIPGFDRLIDEWAHAPMKWDDTDASAVGDAAVFLWSDLARCTTGEILHVDGGHHAVV